MSRLDQLPEITDHVLSGLRADNSLKHRIYQKAAGVSDAPEKKSARLPLAALCAISAVMVAVFALLIPLSRQKTISGNTDIAYDSPDISSVSAGAVLTSSPVKESTENESMTEDSDIRNDENEEADSEQDITENPDANDPDTI